MDAIGTKQGFYTIAHQCKSSDLFLSNSQRWLDFTACNPGAIVMDFISGDQSRRNCPMRYFIRNGAFQETTLLNRHNSSAYYFECFSFQTRLKEVYNSDGSCLNLAYYCVGWDIAVKPIQKIAREEGLIFEFIIECYGVSTSIKEDNEVCQIDGTLVNVDHVSPIHPGDQILTNCRMSLRRICQRRQIYWRGYHHAQRQLLSQSQSQSLINQFLFSIISTFLLFIALSPRSIPC